MLKTALLLVELAGDLRDSTRPLRVTTPGGPGPGPWHCGGIPYGPCGYNRAGYRVTPGSSRMYHPLNHIQTGESDTVTYLLTVTARGTLRVAVNPRRISMRLPRVPSPSPLAVLITTQACDWSWCLDWSGQVRFITRPKSRTMRAERKKKRSRADRTKVPK